MYMLYFLGFQQLFICQTKYAKDMLKKYDMDSCKPVPTFITHGELCNMMGLKW